MNKIEIPIESRLNIQIFAANVLPGLSLEDTVSQLIGGYYRYQSYRQSIVNPKATSLEGIYLAEHLEFMEQAPRMREKDAKELLVNILYLNVGTKAMDEYLNEHWRI